MDIKGKKQSLWGIFFMLCFPVFILGAVLFLWESSGLGASPSLEKGNHIPSVSIIGKDGESIAPDTLRGNVTLINVLPQLNTPVCDDQTHQFSERNGGLDQEMTFGMLSTNTYQDQQKYSAKANIHHIPFLSDAPEYQFRTQTGLLLEDMSILQRDAHTGCQGHYPIC
ncbi:MAG: hypothetical protein NPIRA06_14310 [Nitrospirales bacterium]|nr:MAG: hypothetical protein NPIRA06_14310 [Nitrospirales bacterium]